MSANGPDRSSRFKSIYKQIGRVRTDPGARDLLDSARSALGIPADSAIAWMAKGACIARPDVDWFPTYGEPAEEAKAVCGGCGVRESCLDQAIKRHEYGVWGGTTEREREGLRSPEKKGVARPATPTAPFPGGSFPGGTFPSGDVAAPDGGYDAGGRIVPFA